MAVRGSALHKNPNPVMYTYRVMLSPLNHLVV